ncbi:MAG: DUF4823 domain-containing protein [Gammaproteobacteria bacterium]
MMMRVCFFLSVLALNACGHVHHLYNQGVSMTGATGLIPDHQVQRNGNWVLAQDTSFYVALSGLSDMDTAVLSSDKALAVAGDPGPLVEDQVADLVSNEISRKFPRVMRASAAETLFAARQSALDYRIDFVVYPRIYVWEDTVGTWSEIADALRYRKADNMGSSFGLDRARLQLTLLDSTSGRIIDVVSIETRAGILGLYEENPQRLLAGAVGRYVSSLIP